MLRYKTGQLQKLPTLSPRNGGKRKIRTWSAYGASPNLQDVLIRLVFACSLVVVATAHAIELELPIDCEIGRTCAIQQYADHDPSPKSRDYQYGTLTYDTHNGTDFRLPIWGRSSLLLACAQRLPNTAQYTNFDALLTQADLVLTAEGTLDGQTPYGKCRSKWRVAPRHTAFRSSCLPAPSAKARGPVSTAASTHSPAFKCGRARLTKRWLMRPHRYGTRPRI